LQRWKQRAKTAQALALRARIVLACADGMNNKEVATSMGVTESTVGKWRRRFVAERLKGLDDADRPGRPRTVRDEQVEKVVVDTLEAAPPDGGTHWSTRLMATHTGMSQTAVSLIWRAFGLKPHKVDYWKLSTDPNFIDKLYDVVGLYLNPPERAIVLCADEKSNIQALNRSAPLLPMMPADPARQTHDYIRNGTSSLFAALDVATGTVITRMHRRHRAAEFKKFLALIDAAVPAELDVHLICDNYGTHKTPAIKAWLDRHPRFHMHFTPTGSSWINQVERWFGFLTDQMIRRGAHTSVQALEADIRSWVATWNEDPRPFVWTKTAEEIIESLGRFIQRISGAGH
jgi:transposase